MKCAAIILAICLCTNAQSLGAQSSGANKAASPPTAVPSPCGLLMEDEVAKYIARGQSLTFDEPTSMSVGGAGASCVWGGGRGQIVLFSGPKAEEGLNALLQRFNRDKEPKEPVTGVGERAWVIFPKPHNENEPRGGFLGAKTGAYMVGVSLEADDGKPTESVRPDLIALAKLVVSKLR